MVSVSFTLNGKPITVSPRDGESLLETLRERCSIRSAKDGCSPQGQCGACLAIVGGRAVTTCAMPVEKAEGKGQEIDDYAGLGARKPGLALAMTIFMLSLTGLPPTIGFIGKFYVFRAVLDAGLIWLALVGVVTSLISAYYYLRILIVMYMREGEPETRSEGWLNLTVGLTAFGTFILGILPGPLFELVSKAGLFSFLP